MKLLFLTPQMPWPPQQGAALRNGGLIHALAQRHELHLLTFADAPTPTPPHLASLTTVPLPPRSGAARLRDLLRHPAPDMARRLASPAMAEALASLLQRHGFDLVQVEGIEMVPFALPYLGRAVGPRWIYDAHNAESDLQVSALRADLKRPTRWHAALYSALQVRKLRRFERDSLPRFDGVVAVSQEDAALLTAQCHVDAVVVPNGVDSDHFAPQRFDAAPDMAGRGGPTLLFTGKMDFRPNVDGVLWFADQILPQLADLNPTLWVVGQRPHRALDRLRQQPNIVLRGWVDAVEPYLAAADLVVVPLRMGSGTRLKVLQALSMARPVVGTTLGCAGLAVSDGKELRLADSADDFANAVRQTLLQPRDAAAMAMRGRAHIQQKFDWRVIVPSLEESYQRWLAQ
ncbi:MAG: glycosyltransferase [Anaerolineales bacterium]|nr:glycosyltransferase [Anaerolineales bacterium]MCB9127034.1 glycosyltransferase [Ardenticatenales bacterium]